MADPESTKAKPASPGQRKYIRTLVGQIDWSERPDLEQETLLTAERPDLTMPGASQVIDLLKQYRKKHTKLFLVKR